MISRYRVDFSRLARSIYEIAEDTDAVEFCEEVAKLCNDRAHKVLKDFGNSLPDGHILDSIAVYDKSGMLSSELLSKYVVDRSDY